MPLYKYRCSNCDNTFKILQRNGNKNEDPECPECGAEETERVISSVGIRFKGSGFYRTDYGNNGSYKESGGNGKNGGNGNSSGDTSDKNQSGETSQSKS